MPKFGKKSLAKLKTCHPDLQRIAHEAIKFMDFSVLCGHRTLEEQKKLFAEGHSKTLKSLHLKNPSMAMDLAPFPIDWNDTDRFYRLAGVCQAIAYKYKIPLVWGGDWKTFKDLVHFQLGG